MTKIFIIILCISFLFSTIFSVQANENQAFEISNSNVVTIESKILKRQYDLYIKVPHDYFEEKNKSKKYPILYLNDGPHTFKVAAGVTHFPSMDRAIVVGISFAHGENGQFSRVRDLTPVVDESWKKFSTGGATEYLEFIEKEIFPFIENNYRIDVNNRMLAGHSLGGSFGAWVLLTKPSLFSGYILTSPSLWFNNDYIFDLEKEYYKNSNSLDAKVFIATGSLEVPGNGMRNDMVDGHLRFIKRLRSRNYKGIYISDEIVEGTDHYSTFPVGLAKGLRILYQEL